MSSLCERTSKTFRRDFCDDNINKQAAINSTYGDNQLKQHVAIGRHRSLNCSQVVGLKVERDQDNRNLQYETRYEA